jgi:tRNA A-37 threonylcarbamoyl transferase component Bud32/membrane-associated phospholipid phosphatase
VGRRRRPSGEPPPLPREIRASTRWYLVAVVVTAAFSMAMVSRPAFVAVTDVDGVVLRALARLRFGALTSGLRGVNDAGTSWVVRAVAWLTIAVLVAYRRFRYLTAYLAVVLVGSLGALVIASAVGRLRPTSVSILARWDGAAFPSRPVVTFGLVAVGVVYTLVPSGAWRRRAKLAAAVAVVLFGVTRVYLAVDHPSDVLAALAIGWAMPVAAFRLFTPEDAFPVGYHPGRRAHLDVGGQRGEAIVHALDQQLGLTVVGIETFGAAGSAGSTPLRLTVARTDGSSGVLFAKLYAVSHLRADRWYKLTRTILYGRLEDEKPFSSVRRLAEYEDHMLRLFRDAGLPSPAPYGFAEITPEREYVIVMQLFEGAVEIGSVVVEAAVIDSALSIVRQLWNAGVAHRDIKPSNVLTADGRALLIDVAFATVRPSPWRQAVDLANMMLTLALSSTPALVYERALLQFDADEIAEAFAATRSITVPTQLRGRLREDGRDVMAMFHRLVPTRSAIRIQVWTPRRVALTLTVLGVVGLTVAGAAAYVRAAGLL